MPISHSRHRNLLRRAAVAGATAALVGAGLAAVPASANSSEPALSVTADTSVWGANGRVMDIVPLGDKALIGGGFDYVGPTTGHTVRVSGTSGAVVGDPLMASGDVYAVVGDGAGGWYVGGEFGDIGGKYRRTLAHIKPDGTVDTGFNANMNGRVYALARVGNTLIVGGKFTKGGGRTATNLVAVDGTGAAVPGWSASANNTVYALASDGTKVYVGGQFTNLNGSSRRYLGRINASNGSLDTAFTGQTYSQVRTIALSGAGDVVYVGGDFTSVSGRNTSSTSRGRLAAYSTLGDVLSWNPNANATTRVLTVDPGTGTVYAGGTFTSVGGQSRTALAAITSAGAVTGFNLGLADQQCPHDTKSVYSLPTKCYTDVGAILVDNGRMVVGGQFGTVLGAKRHNAVEIDLSTMSVTAWNPVVGNFVYAALRLDDGDVVLGGLFTSTGGLVRRGLALIDLRTGQADPAFQADVDEMVLDLSLAPDGQSVYVSGDFKTVGGQDRNKVARVDVRTGAVDDRFKAGFNNVVIRIVASGDSVYVGGKFTKVGSVARKHAARLNATTGGLDDSWVADTTGPSGRLRAGGMVQGLEVAPDGSKVYLSGPFTAVNGTSIPYGIVAVSGTNGAVDPRILGGVQGCGSVGPWINRIYLSPDGKRLYAGDVCPDNIYQFDAVNLSTPSNPTGLLWRTWCNGGMQGTLEVNGHFYYGSHGGDKGKGGVCSSSPGGPSVERSRFAAFDSDNGRLLDYYPEFDQPMGVWSYAASDYGLLVGGDFTLGGDRATVAQGFALFRGTP